MIDTTLLDRTRANAMVIRHADRDKMEHGQIYQPLNDIGREHARMLGIELKGFKNYKFFSSPVDRCQETVEFIQNGLFGDNTKNPISISNVLGEPGPFVMDRKNNAFKTISCISVVEKQIAHEDLVGIRPTVDGAKLLLDYVAQELSKADEGSLLVFVTHDAIIGPIIFELTEERFNHDHWPAFADGFIIEQSGLKKRIIRNNKYFVSSLV